MSGPTKTLVVVGAGISGLTAAWSAAAAGFDVLVLEAAPRVGGKLQVADVGGIAVDVGAEAMLAARPEGTALLAETDLAGERISPRTTAANIRVGGRAYPLPARTMLGIPGDIETVRASGVLSPGGLDTLTREPSLPPVPPLTEDVTVGRLVRERVGDEVADRLVQPLLGGVYAGNADELSLRATMPALAARLAATGGSLVRAADAVTGAGTRAPNAGAVFATLRGGMGQLPIRLAESGRFAVRTGVTVRAIRRTPTGFALDCGAVPASESVEADAVIVATPAAKAARLMRDVAPGAATELAGIESASIAIVSFAFSASSAVQVPAGSGLLIATGERLAVKALTLTSQKWPMETDGVTLLRASVGRAGEPHALRLDDAELTTLVRRELQVLTGIEASPLDSLVTRWGGGLPQYATGHVERIARMRESTAGIAGLGVCGAALDGVGIPACIASARAAVARVVDSLAARGQSTA